MTKKQGDLSEAEEPKESLYDRRLPWAPLNVKGTQIHLVEQGENKGVGEQGCW